MYRRTKSKGWPNVQPNEENDQRDERDAGGARRRVAVIRSLVIVLVVDVVVAIGIPAFFGTQAGADRQVQPPVYAHSNPAAPAAPGADRGSFTVPGDLHGAIMANGHLPALSATTTSTPAR